MSFYILVLFLFLTACQNDDINPNISYTTLPETAEIGFPINHNIMINNLGELFTLDSVVWQDSSAWLADSSKIFIKDSKIDTLDSSVSIDYQITFWDTGKVVIPPLNTNISFPDSASSTIFRTDSSFVYISTVIDIPLNVEFIQLFFFRSLKLKGHPFFKTSLALIPSNCIIALECERLVIAKFS